MKTCKNRSAGVGHHIEHPLEDSEALVERTVFRNRGLLLILFALATVILGYQASQLRPQASFERMIPTQSPYVKNFLANREGLKGLGNAVRITLETVDGNIFNAEFMERLKQVHEEVFYIPGVDRSALKSLWAADVRWREVTEQGFVGGTVVPDTYDGSADSLAQLRANVLKSGQVGTLVANDFKSAIVYAPLLERDPSTGEVLDYARFSEDLERLIRDKFQDDHYRIHITGFAKVVGDLIEGLQEVAVFFLAAFLITGILLYAYSRCLRSTLAALFCSTIAVVWLLGLLHSLGYGLDPYSMLVPFLVFAIGVSHAVQVINAIAHQAAEGASKLMAAQYAFRSLYIAGMIALISDGAGFATLMVIEIAVIQDLAVAASIGVASIILTNLVLLPVVSSYIGVSSSGIARLRASEANPRQPIWNTLSKTTRPVIAMGLVLVAIGAAVFGLGVSKNLKIGDLDPGAPELRADSRYNKDNAYVTAHYTTSTDVFVVMVETAPEQCASYQVLDAIDQLRWKLLSLSGVQSTYSLSQFAKLYASAMSEGSLKWMALNRNNDLMGAASINAPAGSFNSDCSMAPLLVFLNDHKAETLTSVVDVVEAFAKENNTESIRFLAAAGNAGIEAATNIVIEKAQYEMLVWVYGVVTLLVFLTFRSLRTVVCIMAPLVLTSLLCQALMTYLGIGVKVATLPVIALGVGIGVDYGIYIYSKLESELKAGLTLQHAYFLTLKTTGKAVAFTGLTLAVGVGTWIFSPIKFQADMGVLLMFMFIWNMIGALTLLPALACLLLPQQRSGIEKPCNSFTRESSPTSC